MRLDTTQLNDDKTFTFTFIDDPTGETKVMTLSDDEIKALNFWHRRMHQINGSIQDFELGG